jgi:hypothetical protein
LRQVFEKVDFIALPTLHLQTLPPTIPLFETMAMLEARMLSPVPLGS